MPAKFATELRNALDKFDYHSALGLVDRVREAEEAGYELTPREENLWKRLVSCIESYQRVSSHVE
jgi:hypothetical protein